MSHQEISINILHIDDQKAQRDFVKLFLEDLNSNFHVTPVGSPEDLLTAVKTGDYDCVISDYNMPEMNGVELAKLVMKTSSIPVILHRNR